MKMYEFEIRYLDTNETAFLYGYNTKDMVRRNPELANREYVVVYAEYID